MAINEFRKSLLEIEYVDRISYAETINSYLGSSDHEIINGNVFIKTKFWRDSVRELENFLENEKQLEIAQALEALRIESAQKLLESGYSVYVYLMEDTRNGLFKIGKSNNPLKRERTLQSEVPTTYLRFALPCEESMESELHQRYSSFRKRGEWFEIDSSMLFDLVTELLSKGDATRILGEREWLGEMLIRRFHKT